MFVFSVFSWMKCSVFLYSAQRHGGPKAKRILHCLSAPLICCFSLAIYAFYCFGRLISPPPTSPPPPSHTLTRFLSPSLSHLATTVLFNAADRNKGQEGESERRIETMRIHRKKGRRFPVSSHLLESPPWNENILRAETQIY